MIDVKALKKIINGSGMSVKHYQDGKVAVTDSQNFRGMKMSALEEAQALVESSIREDTLAQAHKCGIKTLDTLTTISDRAERNIGIIMDCLQSSTPMTAQEMRTIIVKDAFCNLCGNADVCRRNLNQRET